MSLDCKWCGKSFMSERTLAAHMCVKKRRWADREMSHIRLAHRAFQMFYEINTTAKNPKTMEEFIKSQYYEAFVKYGRACQVNEWLEPERYTEHLIRTGVKLKQWSTDKQYDKYLKEYVRKNLVLKHWKELNISQMGKRNETDYRITLQKFAQEQYMI